MKQVTLTIQDNKYAFFMELIQSFSFIKKVEAVNDKTHEQDILDGMQQAVEEVKLFKAGKLTPKPLTEILDEL